MRTIIVGVLGALLVGVFIGSFLFSDVVQKEGEDTIISETPDSSDFLSMRPQIELLSAQELSQDERDGLLFMREEEKLARDVYTTLYDKWGLNIFVNISQSEQTHTESVRSLLVKYGLNDPVTNDVIGVFVNSNLQKLYNDLVAKGLVSVEEALTVGAIIEDLDIADLQKQIAKTDNDDIKLVYENLTRGSRNHLRSFVSQLASRSVVYTPQYITQAEFDEIISTNRETGTGGAGKTGGRGWGNR